MPKTLGTIFLSIMGDWQHQCKNVSLKWVIIPEKCWWRKWNSMMNISLNYFIGTHIWSKYLNITNIFWRTLCQKNYLILIVCSNKFRRSPISSSKSKNKFDNYSSNPLKKEIVRKNKNTRRRRRRVRKRRRVRRRRKRRIKSITRSWRNWSQNKVSMKMKNRKLPKKMNYSLNLILKRKNQILSKPIFRRPNQYRSKQYNLYLKSHKKLRKWNLQITIKISKELKIGLET